MLTSLLSSIAILVISFLVIVATMVISSLLPKKANLMASTQFRSPGLTVVAAAMFGAVVATCLSWSTVRRLQSELANERELTQSSRANTSLKPVVVAGGVGDDLSLFDGGLLIHVVGIEAQDETYSIQAIISSPGAASMNLSNVAVGDHATYTNSDWTYQINVFSATRAYARFQVVRRKQELR